MHVHAYPTEARVPVDLAEARRLADLHLTDPDDATAGISTVVTEFDAGFTVIAVRDPAPILTGRFPPPAIGGSVCVIDKSTGAVSYWPTYPTALIAEQYTDMVSTGGLLVADGWPGPVGIETDDPDTDDAETDDPDGITIDHDEFR